MEFSIGDVVICPIDDLGPIAPKYAKSWRIGICISRNKQGQIYFPDEQEVLIGIESYFFPPEWIKLV